MKPRLLEVAVVGEDSLDSALLADEHGGAVDEGPRLIRAGLVEVESGEDCGTIDLKDLHRTP